MFIDSHSHLFDLKSHEIDMSNITKSIVLSYDVSNFKTALNFCKNNPKCACSLGVYPKYARNYTKNTEQFIRENRKNIVAIGEIGLDSTFDDYDAQIDVFLQQVALAKDLKLPISVHLRTETDHQRFFTLFKGEVPCVLHAFHSGLYTVKSAIDLGCYISFAGNLTYRRNAALREVAKIVPRDLLLVETDAPSMLPAKLPRGTQNTPNNIIYTAETLAEVRKDTLENIARITSENAVKVFNLEGKNGV